MGLSRKREWERRLKAALALRGVKLKDLPDVPGLAERAAARAVHASDDYEPNRPLAIATAEELDLPPEWFLVEDFDAWIRTAGSGAAMDAELRREVKELRQVLGAVAGALQVEVPQPSQREPAPRTDSAKKGAGSG